MLGDFRRRADAVRSLPPETVLMAWGAQRDRCDRSQWRTSRGPLSVTGAKFFNWQCHQGGGGAIDLVMHLGQMDVEAAVLWLERHLGSAPAATPLTSACSPRPANGLRRTGDGRGLRLPVADRAKLERVRRYLTQRRGLATSILEPLLDAGKVYADQRGNAVFLMVAGKANRAVGAELRGTGDGVWHGLAPGTRKDAGYFWVGVKAARRIVLCESAIDAISCFQLHSTGPAAPCICISTAGVRSNAPWLSPLLAHRFHIHCGFDADEPGDAAARAMIALHPMIKRLRPPAHDWNDALSTSD